MSIVTVCTILKFNGLTKVKFCIISNNYLEKSKFSLLQYANWVFGLALIRDIYGHIQYLNTKLQEKANLYLKYMKL